MGSKVRFYDFISEKELKEMVEPELKAQAEEIIKDIELYSLQTLFGFYADYSPMEYRRAYSMIAQGNAIGDIFPKVKMQKKEYGYSLEFTYSSSIISAFHNDGYEWDGYDRGYYIFNGPFMQGYHGGPIFTVDSYKLDSRGKHVVDDYHYEPAPQTVPSPWERIREYARMKYNAWDV